MKRKSVIILFLLLQQIPIFSQKMGSWKAFFSYNNCEQIVQTKELIYCVSNGSLFYVDKELESIKALTKIDGLNDGIVKQIGYSNDYNTLIIAYDNCNFDLLKNGNITNISDLKRKDISGKNVNRIYVEGKYAYLACDFGILVINIPKAEVADTYIIGENGEYESITEVKIKNDTIYALTPSGIKMGNLTNGNLADFSQWECLSIPTLDGKKISRLCSYANQLIAVCNNNIFTLNGSDCTLLKSADSLPVISDAESLIVWANDTLYDYDKNLQITFSTPLPQVNDMVYNRDKNEYWVSIEEYNGNSYLTKLINGEMTDKYLPVGPKSASVAFVKFSQEKIVVGSGGPFDIMALNTPGLLQIYDDNVWYTTEDGDFPEGTKIDKVPFVDVLDAIVDPTDPRRVYVCGWRSLFEFYDNKPKHHFWTDIEELTPTGNSILLDGLFFDKENNLWMANMLSLSPITVMKNDGGWESLYYPELELKETIKETFISNKGYLFALCPRSGQGVFIADLNETPFDERDDKHKFFVSFTDKDGNNIAPNTYRCIAEDQNDVIWIGTGNGPILIQNQGDIFNPDFRVSRVKITREDNKNYADYLLADEQINAIVVDGGNRKWVGTTSSGLYLLSDDGTETLEHFTTENSPLSSNYIMDLALSKETGELMIATSTGLFSFMTDATEGKESYSEVYAYPNPVRETFDGVISVIGLMENSLVRITDSEGKVVHEDYSNGGTFTWNGRDKNGRKVSTGVYFVFATIEDGSSKMVTKIAIIK